MCRMQAVRGSGQDAFGEIPEINFADVGELIEYSDEGFNPVPANEAYKLWINYFVYALTHCSVWSRARRG